MQSETREILTHGQPLRGLANCHVRGLYSLVFRDRIDDHRGMIRVFVSGRHSPLPNMFTDGDFTLLPHNHRQDITLTALCGEPVNWTPQNYRAEVGDYFRECHRFEFASALIEGNFTLKYDGCHHLRGLFPHLMKRDQAIFLGASVFHTMTAAPESAWVVEEGALSREARTSCLSLNPSRKLDKAGLYQPMTPEQLKACWHYVRREWLQEATGQ